MRFLGCNGNEIFTITVDGVIASSDLVGFCGVVEDAPKVPGLCVTSGDLDIFLPMDIKNASDVVSDLNSRGYMLEPLCVEQMFVGREEFLEHCLR